MPIYEYKCAKCGRIIEVMHSSSEKLTTCGEHCEDDDKAGDGELTRLISTPAKITGSRDMALGKVDYDKAAKKGFTTFKRRGKGEYERIAGNAGPKRIISKD